MPDRRALAGALAGPALALLLCLPPAARAADQPLQVLRALPAPAASRAPEGMERVPFAEALARALARNPAAAVALQEVLRAEALVRQSQAAWLPTLSANGSYTRLDADRVQPGTATAPARVLTPQGSLGANLQLAVPVLAPSRWLATGRAKEGVEAAKAGELDSRRTVALAAARAYLAALAARRQTDVAERARDVARVHVDFARSRLQAGSGNRLDEVRAEQELSSTGAALEVQLSGLARAREALGVLLGADGALDAADDPALDPPADAKAALEQLPSTRGDVQAQAARLRGAELAVRDSWADYLPLLTAAFQPFYQDPATLTQPQTGWQAQLVLSIPLFDGGLRYGVARERKALAAEAREQLEGTLRQARSEVRVAFEAVRRADAALVHAREAARLSQQEYELADEGFRAGRLTSLEVIDAQRRARDAAASAVTAEDAARQGRLELLAAAGRLP